MGGAGLFPFVTTTPLILDSGRINLTLGGRAPTTCATGFAGLLIGNGSAGCADDPFRLTGKLLKPRRASPPTSSIAAVRARTW
jgi:hypothetical protein